MLSRSEAAPAAARWGARSLVALAVLAFLGAGGDRAVHAQESAAFLTGQWDGSVDIGGSPFPVRVRARPEIDPRRIGLLGHSEGGAVAAVVAAANHVAFVVLLAPPGLRTDELLRQQAAADARASGAGEEAVVRIMAAHRRATEAARTNASVETLTSAVKALLSAQYDALPPAQRAVLGERDTFVVLNHRPAVAHLSSPWMRAMLDFNPLTTMRQVRCPALVLFGSLDRQVPPALNQAPVRTAFGGNPDAIVKVYDKANHLFQSASTGLASEYVTLQKAFVSGLLEEIGTWVSSVVRR